MFQAWDRLLQPRVGRVRSVTSLQFFEDIFTQVIVAKKRLRSYSHRRHHQSSLWLGSDRSCRRTDKGAGYSIFSCSEPDVLIYAASKKRSCSWATKPYVSMIRFLWVSIIRPWCICGSRRGSPWASERLSVPSLL